MWGGSKITNINYLREKLHKTLKLCWWKNCASKGIEKLRKLRKEVEKESKWSLLVFSKGSVYLYSCTNNFVVICTGILPRSIHAFISSSIIFLHFTAFCTVPCCCPCHVHCGGRGWDQHQLPQCQWQAAQLCQPHFTSDCWYIFSRSQGRFGTFFSKSFYQLLEADGEDTSLVFSPTPSLLGDHCMRVLHLAEPNLAWGQQTKPHGYSTVGQKEMMVTGVSENTTLFSFLSGKFCISSWYQQPPSNTPNMTSNCLSPAYNAPFTFLTPATTLTLEDGDVHYLVHHEGVLAKSHFHVSDRTK